MLAGYCMSNIEHWTERQYVAVLWTRILNLPLALNQTLIYSCNYRFLLSINLSIILAINQLIVSYP